MLNVNNIVNYVEPIYHHKLGVRELIAEKINFDKIYNINKFFKQNAVNSSARFSAIELSNTITNIDDNREYSSMINNYYYKIVVKLDVKKELKFILKFIIKNKSKNEKNFYSIYKFIQNSFFHHPTFQIFKDQNKSDEFYALKCLYSGVGRCGQVSNFSNVMFKLAGYDTRVTQLFSHVCCEVFVDNKWLLVDADSFKEGIYPKNLNDQWATLEEVKNNYYLLDKIPSLGRQLSFDGIWAKNHFNKTIQGYHDIGLSWDKKYLSHLYFGNNYKSPLECKSLLISNTEKKVKISSNFNYTNLKKIIISVLASPRGWSYEDYPSKNIFNHSTKKALFLSVMLKLLKKE